MSAGLPFTLTILSSLSLLVILPILILSAFTTDRLSTILSAVFGAFTIFFHAFCLFGFFKSRDVVSADYGSNLPPLPSGYASKAGILMAYTLVCQWLLNLGIATRGGFPSVKTDVYHSLACAGMIVESVVILAIGLYSTLRRYRVNKVKSEARQVKYYMGYATSLPPVKP